LNSWNAEVTDAVQTTVENFRAINSSRTLLETRQMAVGNVTLDFISQQGHINNTETAVEDATRLIEDATYDCNNASASVTELQSQLDNIGLLSYEDIVDIRNRIMLVELSVANIENMTAILNSEFTRQRDIINTLENEIAGITTERDILIQLYNSLPQSCDEVI